MTYKETIQYLYSALPMYQRIGAPAYKADLENAYTLDEYFDFPHTKYKTVHVAGTNGKGSVSHMLASVFQENGYKTGLFTSPHLLDFKERIRVNGEMVPEQFVVEFSKKHMQKFKSIGASFFEMTVFMAFCYFEYCKVDIAVVEVGLGGRLDTTNIIRPEISIITNIGIDNTQFLGNSLPSIAKEKGGIIKHDVPVVIGEHQTETDSVFKELAMANSAELLFADELLSIEYSLTTTDEFVNHKLKGSIFPEIETIACDLRGSYQKKNIVTSLVALNKLAEKGWHFRKVATEKGFRNVVLNTSLLGRWQRLGNNPLIVCDIAHNAEGFKSVITQIENTAHKKLFMILGFVNDKDVSAILKLLPKYAKYILCEPRVPRAMKNSDLARLFQKFQLDFMLTDSINSAHSYAVNTAEEIDLIYIGGSTFLVADYLAWKKN